MSDEAGLTRRTALDLLTQWLRGADTDGRPLPALSEAAWIMILQEAVSHGVHLLLYHGWCVAGPAPSNLPAYVRRFLGREYAANRQRNQRLQHELVAILESGFASGVAFLPFKGARLICDARVYPTPAVRPLADLDLLIRPDDLVRARRIMQDLGYIEERRATWKHLTFVKPDNARLVSLSASDPHNPRRVELHTRLAEDFLGLRLDLTEAAWRQHPAGSASGREGPLLSGLLLFAHVAAHTAQDAWERKARLIQLVDLARIVPHLEDAEQAVLARADADGPFFAEPRLLLPALLMLERSFPGTLPDGLSLTLARRVHPQLLAWLHGTSLADVSLSNDTPRRLHDNLRWTQTPRERLVAVRRLVLPDRYGLLAHATPRLVESRLYLLAYPVYLLSLFGWLGRRLRRDGRRRYMTFHQHVREALAAAIHLEAQADEGVPAA